MLTAFGTGSAAIMVAAYAFEQRSTAWIAVFAIACVTTSAYGALTGAWLFAALELVWAAIALQRFISKRKTL